MTQRNYPSHDDLLLIIEYLDAKDVSDQECFEILEEIFRDEDLTLKLKVINGTYRDFVLTYSDEAERDGSVYHFDDCEAVNDWEVHLTRQEFSRELSEQLKKD